MKSIDKRFYRGCVTRYFYIMGRLVAVYAVDCDWWNVGVYRNGQLVEVKTVI